MVLLTVVVVEEIALFELRKHVRDPHARAAAVVVFFGVAFAFATSKLGPWLTRLFSRARRGTRREAGRVGVWVFYAVGYGVLYWAFYVMETRGVARLIP